MSEILLATGNLGKLREMRDLVAGIDIRVLGLSDLPRFDEVPETGETFRENAVIKAVGYAKQAGKLALADDSGLEVAALGGRPGVYSARYGGDGLDFAGKMRLLLSEIEKMGSVDRAARFVCSVALADPNGKILFETSGICDGQIAHEPRGFGGFGYDPLFIPNGYDKTFGELDSARKREISHRGAAFRQIIPFLLHYNALPT